MKVTLDWLKQYVDFNWSPGECQRSARFAREKPRADWKK
jgi:hypothetical protein